MRVGEDIALLCVIHELFRVLSDDELLVFVYSVYGGHENSEKEEAPQGSRAEALHRAQAVLQGVGLAHSGC